MGPFESLFLRSIPILKNILISDKDSILGMVYFWRWRVIFRHILYWRPLKGHCPGYTIITGCSSDLREILEVNLMLLAKQDIRNLHEVLLVWDIARDDGLVSYEGYLRGRYPQLRIRFIFYNKFQHWLLRRYRRDYFFCWLSWCKGIKEAETKYVMLHDLDAFLLKPGFIEERYKAIAGSGSDYLGIMYYNVRRNRIVATDNFLVTQELFVDIETFRKRHKPIDAFNSVWFLNGRIVHYDSFLYVQTLSTKKLYIPIDNDKDWIHSYHMICQYTNLIWRDVRDSKEVNNLLFIPYYMHLAGNPSAMALQMKYLSESDGATYQYFIDRIRIEVPEPDDLKWIAAKIKQMEEFLFGSVKGEPQLYREALEWLGARGYTLNKRAEEDQKGHEGT